jgi:hypothetical protein
MSKRKKVIGGVAAALLLVGGLVVWWWSGDNAQVEKVKQLQASMMTGNGPPSREKMEEMRQEMEKLTPAQRQQVMEPMRHEMQRRMEKTMDDYFALPAAQRPAFLDAQIKEMENRFKDFGNRRPPGGPGPGGPGGPGGPPGGPGGPRDMGSDTGKLRRNEMLDHMTPSRRAKMDAYFADMAKRRMELGLSPMPTPPRGGGTPPR